MDGNLDESLGKTASPLHNAYTIFYLIKKLLAAAIFAIPAKRTLILARSATSAI